MNEDVRERLHKMVDKGLTMIDQKPTDRTLKTERIVIEPCGWNEENGIEEVTIRVEARIGYY